MNESKITVRYAKALIELAKENNASEQMKNDMELLHQCIQELPEMQYVISSPVIKVSEKVSLFAETFKSAFSPTTQTFIKLVIERRREEYLQGIARHFLYLLKADSGIKVAEVVTAIPLDEKLRKSILQFIRNKFHVSVELQESIDEQLIGGFILRIADQQVDASISTKLSKIKSTLTNSHT